MKESEWPVELFYNKTVNMYKKKQTIIGEGDATTSPATDWALEFRIADEFEAEDNVLDVQYTLVRQCELLNKKNDKNFRPITRQVTLRPVNPAWNHRLKTQQFG